LKKARAKKAKLQALAEENPGKVNKNHTFFYFDDKQINKG